MITKTIKTTTGTEITLELSEEWDEITFYEKGEKLDGEFVFLDDLGDGKRYLLKRMYVPEKYKRQGIGEQVLRFFKSCTGAIVWVRENDGISLDDGSHLTEDAPAFVQSMQELGLIGPYNNL